MIPALRLAAADFRFRGPVLFGATMLAAVPLTGMLLLHAFAAGIDADFAEVASGDLIVQEANSVGEITGSRIPESVGVDLIAAGAAFAIPEIHAVAGSSAGDAILVRGIDPARYRSVTGFEMVDGSALGPNDLPGTAMLGVDLAEARLVTAGDAVSVRGRIYPIVGVFRTGTYADNEIWLSLGDARSLLGWDEGVSLFVIPGDGPIEEGDSFPGPLGVARRGDFVTLAGEWDPVFALADLANAALAAASGTVIAAVLWRNARMRGRDLAVLRSIGMGRSVTVLYLVLEGTAIAALGLATAILAARAMGAVVAVDGLGLTIGAVFDSGGIVRAATVTAAVLVVAVATAATGILRARPADLLRVD